MRMKTVLAALAALPLVAIAALPKEVAVKADAAPTACGLDVRNFVLRGEALCEPGAEAALAFHSDGRGGGYEVLFRNGPIDGSRKTGSLSHVRNLYRALAKDGEWFPFEVSVRGRAVEVVVGGQPVVRYVEPERPWRSPAHAAQRLGRGDVAFAGRRGTVRFRSLALETLADDAPARTDGWLAPVDEQTDRAIRLQQRDFPVIDYHVHLKGGLTRDLALAKSFAYGIDYGVAPNIGEGGVGEMYSTDESARAYADALRPYPFLCAAQGEGRRWALNFRPETFAAFDYVFTDAMTVVDGGRPLRIYRDDEFLLNGRTTDEWMDFLVDQTVKILENEPADVYANATYLPESMQGDYERHWTDARVNRVLDVLQKNGIALEISARYWIPSARIVRMAKARGIKFTFGTNNANADFGRLEYALDTAVACGLTADDMWFPSMSTRARRKAVAWNAFATSRLSKANAVPFLPAERRVRRLPLAAYRDRMKAAWVGQIAGVAWGWPTEFRYRHKIIPDDKWFPWKPEMSAEAFSQDDIYVEITFLKTLVTYGYGVSQRQAAIDFANSRYRLWHANAEGRNLLRKGVAPPDSANPRLNPCANDIDYQIEADYSGIIAPGCPQAAVRLGEKFGGVMNYADGLYGGQFVGALYCAAFFETNLVAVVREALAAIPERSRYAEMVRDLLAWHAEDPKDWKKAWEKTDRKYGYDGPCFDLKGVIDAPLNGAMVLLGVLWGDGDPDRTIEIACRGGFDSDCNPSSAAGVVFTTIGFSRLPARFTSGLDMKRKFEFTDYTIPELVDVCERLAREVVAAEGGRVVNDPVLGETFEIPVTRPTPSPFASFRAPAPLANSRFTAEEAAKIRFAPCKWGEQSAPKAGK